jgi:L-lactate utilization protein LutC
MATINENSTGKIEQKKQPSKIGIYILSHKLVFSLLFALVVVSCWAFIKMSIMEKDFEKQSAELTTSYENKMDSLTTKQLMLTSKVFSWAIRSELTRENKEQVNQYFLSFIKESGVNKVAFVDAKTSKMTLSTDKKDEGTMYINQLALSTDEIINFTEDSVLNVISPVMGLNNKLGVLVIEYRRK